MSQIPAARIIDISNIVRVRKQLAWASNWVGALGSYETALRIGGMLAITTGVEPALSRA